jgi:hypothetical protein
MPIIDLTDDELAAVTATVRRAIEDDRYPHAPARGEGRAKRYLRPSIHWVSACEPRPSAASAAALYPPIACSLDMTPFVRRFLSRSARKPATASGKTAHVYADERALFSSCGRWVGTPQTTNAKPAASGPGFSYR